MGAVMTRAPEARLYLDADEIIVERDAGRFVPGTRPSPATEIQRGQHLSVATEIKPGQHLSATTEFKPGQPAHNKLPVGSVTTRMVFGRPRAFVKIAEPNVWRARAKVVWEREHGCRLPRGKVVHHKDRDTMNDAPENLVALTRSEHAMEHADEARLAGFGSDESLAKARAARRRSA